MPKSAKMSHAARVLKIRELLDARPFLTIKGLQQQFGVSRKTVYNDLAALQEAGVPVYSETGPAGEARWMLQTAAKKKLVTMTIGEVVPLGLARLALSFLDGTDVHDRLGDVVNKLGQGATPTVRKHLAALGKKVAIVPHGPKSYARQVDVLDDLLTGLLNDQLVAIRYRSPGKRTTRHVLEPLSLVLYREALYLIANSRTYDGLRMTFAVDRISSASWLKGEHFDYPEDFDPQQQLDGAFGLVGGEPEQVEILFAPDQAAYVRERRWHPTQRFEALDDGRVRMTMTVRGTSDVLWWLAGHTGTFEVRRPAALRQEIRERAASCRAAHGRGRQKQRD